jgi:hypothetical protein
MKRTKLTAIGVRQLNTKAARVKQMIRLADSLCGLVRAAYTGQEDMQELLDWGVKTGAIRDLS